MGSIGYLVFDFVGYFDAPHSIIASIQACVDSRQILAESGMLSRPKTISRLNQRPLILRVLL